MVREAPAPDPLHRFDGPSHPSVENEPVLNVDNIQGNILAGFNKNYQSLIFLRIDDPERFKHWLQEISPCIATLSEVVAFNRLFKSSRTRRGKDPAFSARLKATWVNIAFTYEGLQVLHAPDLPLFKDGAFREGMRSRSPSLGDELTPGKTGHPSTWHVVDGADDPEYRERIAHVLVIVAGDDQEDVDGLAKNINEQARQHGAAPVGFTGTGRDDGENLPGTMSGHEHFGFLDGVSQPGVRGRLSSDPHDVLTPRQNPQDPDQGKPGQDLVWPGEFVFGYPEGPANPDGTGPSFTERGLIASAGPDWTVDGSFLVFRRLNQKVGLFHGFLHEKRKELWDKHGAGKDASAHLVGAQLVGRWQSGAPVLRTRNPDPAQNDKDEPALGEDDCANNHFEFQEDADPLVPRAIPDPFDCSDANPPAQEDRLGLVCPFSAHIRKVYPRDDETLNRDHPVPQLNGAPITTVDGEAEVVPNENDVQTHRLLRRGIPFGRSLRHGDAFSTPDEPLEEDHADRGLHFVAYQTSIEDQFEFITKNWVNNPDFMEPEGSDVRPLAEGKLREPNERSGYDPIIGQNNREGQNRVREFTVGFVDQDGQRRAARLTTADAEGNGLEWVIPTGGGYFFAPSIRAIREVLSRSEHRPRA
jgi:Dyp-type peroxidase family